MLKNKKILIIFLIIVSIFISAGLAVYFLNQKRAETAPSAGETKEPTLAEKQLKELEELRNKAGVQPLTEEQKAAQLKELEALWEKARIKPLTQVQIQKQLDELAALKEGEPRPDESGRENLRQGR